MTRTQPLLELDPAVVRRARALARRAAAPVVQLAQRHTTVSVERATLRLAGLAGADHERVPWVNHLVDAVRDQVGLEHGITTPVWDALLRGEAEDVTVVCVDVPGCEQPAILSTAQGGTIIFFSMATNFAAAALGAEGLAADVTMLIGNGYVPGHADLALDLVRTTPCVRELFEQRVAS